jgi:hypothetical protein
MSMHPGIDNNLRDSRRHREPLLLASGQIRFGIALILIAMGIVFFLGQANILDYGGSWWVIFIAIPGLILLWAGRTTHQQAGKVNTSAVIQGFLGAVCILLSIIFVFDPTWSFTRGWRLDTYFPFLRDINWGQVWPWFLVVPGVVLLYSGYSSRSISAGVIGGALVVVGLVFILNISWNAVWPLAIVAVGVWLLFGGRQAVR